MPSISKARLDELVNAVEGAESDIQHHRNRADVAERKVNRELFRLGDWNRGAALTLTRGRVVFESWGYREGRYRHWRLGPFEVHVGVMF